MTTTGGSSGTRARAAIVAAASEAVFGLTSLADSTGPVCWVLIEVAALALLVAMLVRRIRGALWKVLAVIGTCVTAGAFVVAHGWLGGV